jgi:hypothetical protein
LKNPKIIKVAGIGNISKIFLKSIICTLLMAWIFHSIFLYEAELAYSEISSNWEELTPSQKRHEAWVLGPTRLFNILTEVDTVPLLLSLVMMGTTILIGVQRWRIVLKVQGLPLSMARTAEISLVAHFFNSFFLGSTGGDLMKAYYAARETHHLKTEAVMTVVIDRLMGLFSMLLFACLMMLPNWSYILSNEGILFLCLFTFAMLLGCGSIIGLALWGHWFKSGHSVEKTCRKWIPKWDLLKRSLDACRVFGNDKHLFAKILTLSMLLNLACVFQITALVGGLQIEVDWKVFLVIVPMIICISALPITPNGLGVRENLYVLALAPAMVPSTKALALSLLAYAGSLFWSLFGGLVYMAFRERHHLTEVTQSE